MAIGVKPGQARRYSRRGTRNHRAVFGGAEVRCTRERSHHSISPLSTSLISRSRSLARRQSLRELRPHSSGRRRREYRGRGAWQGTHSLFELTFAGPLRLSRRNRTWAGGADLGDPSLESRREPVLSSPLDVV